MHLSESVVAEQIDEILRRARLRLERQRIQLQQLPMTSPHASAARAMLKEGLAAFERLEAYRARFSHRAYRPSVNQLQSHAGQRTRSIL
jgi:hypothetical protein